MEIHNFREERYSNEQMYRSIDWLIGHLGPITFTNEIDATYKEVALQALETILNEME